MSMRVMALTLSAVLVMTAACAGMAGCSCSVNEQDVASAASDGAAMLEGLLSSSSFEVVDDGTVHGKLGMFALDGDEPDEDGRSVVHLTNAENGDEYATGSCVMGDDSAVVTFGVFGVGIKVTAQRTEDGTWTSSVGLA